LGSVGETQIRFNCQLKITLVQLTGDLTFIGETGPKASDITVSTARNILNEFR